jgi:hypothetical protein
MRLDTFLLADAVSAPPDGKIYVQGGGISGITLSSTPAQIERLMLLARWEITEESDFLENHFLEVALIDPDGGYALPPQSFQTAGAIPDDEGPPDVSESKEEEKYFVLVLSLGGTTLTRGGPHRLRLKVDDDVVRSMVLSVTVTDEREPAATETPQIGD